jgi:hypothetical protein
MAQVVVVEQVFDPPLTDEEDSRIGKRIDVCAELRKARWMRSYLSADRRRDAYHSAGLAVERVWGAELYKRA